MANLNKVRQRREKIRIAIGEFAGMDRALVYDLNAYALMEEKYGNVDEALKILQNGTIKGMRELLWFGLIHQTAVYDKDTGELLSPGLSVADIGSWMDLSMLEDFSDQVSAAFTSSLPDAVDEAKLAPADPEAATIVMTPEEAAAAAEEEEIKKY